MTSPTLQTLNSLHLTDAETGDYGLTPPQYTAFHAALSALLDGLYQTDSKGAGRDLQKRWTGTRAALEKCGWVQQPDASTPDLRAPVGTMHLFTEQWKSKTKFDDAAREKYDTLRTGKTYYERPGYEGGQKEFSHWYTHPNCPDCLIKLLASSNAHTTLFQQITVAFSHEFVAAAKAGFALEAFRRPFAKAQYQNRRTLDDVSTVRGAYIHDYGGPAGGMFYHRHFTANAQPVKITQSLRDNGFETYPVLAIASSEDIEMR